MNNIIKKYDEYISPIIINKKILSIEQLLPSSINNLKNIIIYGPNNAEKYANILYLIKKYSPSLLKHEKKIKVIFNKEDYFYKISDIHYEVDISLLGCNSKQLWHEIFQNIINIISSKKVKSGIIVCRNFNEIQPELMENFYSYIQKNINCCYLDIKFILICEQISFFPENILNSCDIVNISYNSPNILYKPVLNNHYITITDKLVSNILYVDKLNYLKFRETIYDIFIYNLDMNICIWNILRLLFEYGKINNTHLSMIMVKTFLFLKFYQNNYRPISHVEHYLYYLISITL